MEKLIALLEKLVAAYRAKQAINQPPIVNPIEDKPLPPPAEPAPPTVEQTIRYVASQNGVDPDLAVAVAHCESGLNPKAVRQNPGSKDRGLFQWNDYFHKEITDAMAFDPATATKLFCDAVKQGKLQVYWVASQPCWSARYKKPLP